MKFHQRLASVIPVLVLAGASLVDAQTAGTLTAERWSNLPSSVSLLTLRKDGISSRNADSTTLLAGSQWAPNQGEHYGVRLRGSVTPPVTGSYTFFVAGDDNSELFISSDSSRFNKKRIAWHHGYTGVNQWDKYSTQRSAPVQLTAGQKYYIEAQMMEGGGGDHLSIGWALNTVSADGSVSPAIPEPIPATQLESIAPDANDSNDDNLPDDWQLQFPITGPSFDQSEFGDPDRDLVTNLEEAQLATDPNIPTGKPAHWLREAWFETTGYDVADLIQQDAYFSTPDFTALVTGSVTSNGQYDGIRSVWPKTTQLGRFQI